MTGDQKIKGNNQEIYILRRLRVISLFGEILVGFVFPPVTIHLVGVVARAPLGASSPSSPLPAAITGLCLTRWPPLAVLNCPLIQSSSRTAWQVADGVGTTLASLLLARPA